MQYATPEQFFTAYDNLKAQCRCKYSNIFLDSQALQGTILRKKCFFYQCENSIFILIPYHNSYYDCLFMAKDDEALTSGFASLQRQYFEALPVRCSIIGKEPLAGSIANKLEEVNFKLTKKLLRMQTEGAKPKVLAAMRLFAEEYRDKMFFAEEKDAKEILEILKDNFDVIADNLPEYEAIVENIAKKQVAVLRQDNRIASLDYFVIQNSAFHGIYNVTRKEYRGGNGFFMALSTFVNEHAQSLGLRYARSHGWIDATNMSLVSHAHKTNKNFDGIVIYNMLWTPE